MPKIHFITFATPAFQMRQWLLNRSAKWFGQVDVIHAWSSRRLDDDGFTKRHPELFEHSVGYGWYSWKPYIILQALQIADEGDLLIYQDVGRRVPVLISRPLRGWDRFLSERHIDCIAGVRIPDWGPNRLWTKRSVFHSLGLCGERYEDEPQVQASWLVWKKCSHTEKFVREWAELCQRLDLVGGQLANGPEGETPGFREHRWDQSLLTLLALRDSLPTLGSSERRNLNLNEKAIDSFSFNQKPPFWFMPFVLIVNSYYFFETFLKKLFRCYKTKIGIIP